MFSFLLKHLAISTWPLAVVDCCSNWHYTQQLNTGCEALMAALHDKFGRAIRDLRISITDRCNYKCVYCRTGNEGALYGDLPFDDYLRMARILVGMGITKVRLTGGEPLLRKGVVGLRSRTGVICALRRDRLERANRSTSRSRPMATCWPNSRSR